MKNYQSIFAPYMERYLKQKRSLGFKNIGMEYTFTLFDRFALQETVSNACISKELALKWAVQRPNESPRTRYIRIAEINQLSAFLSSLGNESFLSRLPKVQHFYSPYIFSTQQIKEFFEAADSMFLKCRQYDTSISAVPVLFRMLYATGIRLEEALNLRDVDVDVLHKTLFIKGAKNGQDRRIPISASLAQICIEYRMYRNQHITTQNFANEFFQKHNGGKCHRKCVYNWFRRILRKTKIPHLGKGAGPHIHCLRHTYGVHALAAMINKGLDLYYALPLLSCCLGHKSIVATEQYIRLTSEVYPSIISEMTSVSSYVFPKKTKL